MQYQVTFYERQTDTVEAASEHEAILKAKVIEPDYADELAVWADVVANPADIEPGEVETEAAVKAFIKAARANGSTDSEQLMRRTLLTALEWVGALRRTH